MLNKNKSFEIIVHPGNETKALRETYGYWQEANWGREKEELKKLNLFLDNFKINA